VNMERETGRFARDRDGEIFQSDLTEEDLPDPAEREEADHELQSDPDVDSEAGDEFMRKRQFPPTQ
jgi:hypothetical protein